MSLLLSNLFQNTTVSISCCFFCFLRLLQTCKTKASRINLLVLESRKQILTFDVFSCGDVESLQVDYKHFS
jgi:hypothetical protein